MAIVKKESSPHKWSKTKVWQISFLLQFSAVLESNMFFTSTDFDVVLTTYETVVSDSVRLSRIRPWECVVLDEGHRIKNFTTKLSTSVKGLKTRQRVILTG